MVNSFMQKPHEIMKYQLYHGVSLYYIERFSKLFYMATKVLKDCIYSVTFLEQLINLSQVIYY
jgi:hypothetical protein